MFQSAPDPIALQLPQCAAEALSLAPDGPVSAAYRFDTPEIKAANHRLHGFPTHQLRHTRAAQMVLEVGKARGEATVNLRQLNRRCGPLTVATTARIQTLSLAAGAPGRCSAGFHGSHRPGGLAGRPHRLKRSADVKVPSARTWGRQGEHPAGAQPKDPRNHGRPVLLYGRTMR